MKGRCTNCSSEIDGIIVNIPDFAKGGSIDFTYRGNFKKCRVGKKRRLTGQKRIKFADELLREKLTVSRIHKREAARFMDFGDPEPAHLPSLNAPRVLKCKTRGQMHLHPDPVLSSVQLKQYVPYNEIIRSVG